MICINCQQSIKKGLQLDNNLYCSRKCRVQYRIANRRKDNNYQRYIDHELLNDLYIVHGDQKERLLVNLEA